MAIEECLHAFQTAKDQISEQTKSWLGKREQSRMQALTVKARELKLGVNREICLREMRETAYNIGRSERANEKNRPAWYILYNTTNHFLFHFLLLNQETSYIQVKNKLLLCVAGMVNLRRRLALLSNRVSWGAIVS